MAILLLNNNKICFKSLGLRLFVLFCCTSTSNLFCQESPEKVNEVFKAYNSMNYKQDSIQRYLDELDDKMTNVTYREALLVQSGGSGLASVLISLGTNIGSISLLAQGETQASTIVSIAGQTLSTILLARAFILLSKAGNELADERLKKQGLLVE